jgi:ankyrin repeat protein
VKLLLAAGVDVDLANKRGLSALGEAVAGGHVGIAEALLRAGADPNWRSAGCVHRMCVLISHMGVAERVCCSCCSSGV